MESITFQIDAEPPGRTGLENRYATLVEEKARVKRRSLQMMGVGILIYLSCFGSWMIYREGMLSVFYPVLTLGATLGWVLALPLHHIYTSQTRNRAILIIGVIAIVLTTFAFSSFSLEVALGGVAAYLVVLVMRYLLDNRMIDVIALNQKIRDLTYLELDDPKISAELERMRAIAEPVDQYLKRLALYDRPLVVGEFLLFQSCYEAEQSGAPLVMEVEGE